MSRALATGLLFCATAAVLAQALAPTVTAVFVSGEPNCGQFGVLSCPGSSAGAQLTSADRALSDSSFFDTFRFPERRDEP